MAFRADIYCKEKRYFECNSPFSNVCALFVCLPFLTSMCLQCEFFNIAISENLAEFDKFHVECLIPWIYEVLVDPKMDPKGPKLG